MTRKEISMFYDKEADTLEITIGEPSASYFDEVEDDLFEAHDKKTNELKGYKVFNFLKRGGMKNIKILLPANVSISD
jgi:hypothetical protein